MVEKGLLMTATTAETYGRPLCFQLEKFWRYIEALGFYKRAHCFTSSIYSIRIFHVSLLYPYQARNVTNTPLVPEIDST